jgi:ABC-type transport system involved in multi-copper enzyme maturation permease subunit
MTLLPVAHRELLTTARRPSTHRVRIGSAALAAAVGVIAMLFIGASGAGKQSGQFLFNLLWFGVLGFSTLAGVFLTADALSEERRDGTLPLLFLTDLNGFEIVAGKFIGGALNAAYGVAAVFPVMATAWFLGGITDGEFWRALLSTLNTLFVSLSLGLCVSSITREQSRAVGVTFLLLILLQGAFPGLGTLLQRFGPTQSLGALTWFSPAMATIRGLDAPYTRAPGDYWQALATSHAFGWLLLATAGWLLTRHWQDRPRTLTTPASQGRWPGLSLLGGRRPSRRQVDRNPLAALFARNRVPGLVVWLLAGLAIVSAVVLITNRGLGFKWLPKPVQMGLYYGVFSAGLLLFKTLYAWESTAFFGEARRTGALDLALTTPLTDAEIRSAHSRHLWSSFGIPLAILLGADVVAILGAEDGVTSIPWLGAGWLGAILQCWSMGAVGAWLSLTEKRPLVALAKTLGLCVIVPTVLNFVCCLGLIVPPLLRGWAETKLSLPFRQVIAGVRSQWQVRGHGHGDTRF